MKGTGSFDRVADVPNEKVVAPEPRKRGWVEIGGRGHIVEDRAPCGDPHALYTAHQGGITCGAIDEPRKSLKAIDERVIINFRDKNVVISRFRVKNVECLYIYYGVIEE